MATDNQSGLILEKSLQVYFYDQLQELNRKSSNPLPNETIYYSSLVMDEFSISKNFFETEEGKFREKVLGTKLLESSKLSKVKQKRALKDIGDTALFICGYFSESLNRKIIDISYYQQLGQTAYNRLDNFIPEVYEIPSFFSYLSRSFSSLTGLINIVSSDLGKNSNNQDAVLFIAGQGIVKAS